MHCAGPIYDESRSVWNTLRPSAARPVYSAPLERSAMCWIVPFRLRVSLLQEQSQPSCLPPSPRMPQLPRVSHTVNKTAREALCVLLVRCSAHAGNFQFFNANILLVLRTLRDVIYCERLL